MTVCSECYATGTQHRTGCPSQEEARPLYICVGCGEGIYEDDRYKEIGDEYWCHGCLMDMSPSEIFELLGDPIQYAHAI